MSGEDCRIIGEAGLDTTILTTPLRRVSREFGSASESARVALAQEAQSDGVNVQQRRLNKASYRVASRVVDCLGGKSWWLCSGQ